MTLNEAETRNLLIDPALQKRGWGMGLGTMRLEQSAGKVRMVNGRARRSSTKTADYTLQVRPSGSGQPVKVGVVEAKAERFPPNHGLEQAKQTAERHNVPFAFSSNGHLYVEHDSTTGITTEPRSFDDFPTTDELQRRYELGKEFTFDQPDVIPLLTPYYQSEDSVRYYQDAAIRAVFEKIAKGENRALLSLATGTGKTHIAVNILKRIADAGQLRRALFVCDRDELRSQGWGALNEAFGSDAAQASTRNPEKNARVIVATYQTLGVDTEEGDSSFLKTHYPENYFSHIVIDECHRSAWNKWSEVLTRNSDAVQIGLTATPRQFENLELPPEDQKITNDNILYFGFPAYEYGIGRGIDDGYLALMQVERRETFIAQNIFSEHEKHITRDELGQGQLRDARTGESVAAEDMREEYGAPTLEQRLIMPDRVHAMCEDLFELLVNDGDPRQKTIIFCVSIDHANRVQAKMNNLYAQWCQASGVARSDPYAFSCTAETGREHISDLRGASTRYFVATTVDLLSTGVDVPVVENIVFFRYLNSPIAFQQMIGRGTRIDEARGKLAFTIYDYTDATRLMGADLQSRADGGSIGPNEPPEREKEQVIEVQGMRVHVRPAGRFIAVSKDDGNVEMVSLEEYEERVKEALVNEVGDVEELKERWVDPARRRDSMLVLPDQTRSANLLREVSGLHDYDLFDVLAGIAFGFRPLTRADRAKVFESNNRSWLDGMPDQTRNTILAIASQFGKGGIENLEHSTMLNTPEVARTGGASALNIYPYGDASAALRETKRRLFAV